MSESFAPPAASRRFHGSGGFLAADVWQAVGEELGVVLLMHGGGQTRHSWRAAGPMLAGQGWTAVALDARGHGESDWAADGDYGLDALIEDLSLVVHQLPQPPVIIGASMGGITALVAQGERGDLARALVLVDIAPRVEPKGIERIREFMTAGSEGFDSLEEVAAAVRAYQPHRERPVNVDSLRKNLRSRDGRWFWHWDPAFIAPRQARISEDFARRGILAAPQIRVPTLLVRGEHSDVVTTDGLDELARLIPGARQVEVGNTGHMVAGDDNAVFLTSVAGFLSDLQPRAADRG